MKNFKHFDLLEAVELWAADNNLQYPDEESVSAAFDEQVAEAVVARYGADDAPAMSEAFSAFTDNLETEHELHSEQVKHYVYMGKYASDD